MKKSYYFVLIVISFVALLLFPINIATSLFMCFGALILAFLTDDYHTTKKVLQPTLVHIGVTVLYGFINLFLQILNEFASLSQNYFETGLYDFVCNTLTVTSAVCYIFVFVVFVVGIIFYTLKKDIPLVSKLADKVLKISTNKKTLY